jgi:hypothetical protein
MKRWALIEKWSKVMIFTGLGLLFQPLAYVLLIRELGWNGEKLWSSLEASPPPQVTTTLLRHYKTTGQTARTG